MKNAKQEVIKKAYGEYWDIVKDYVDENGWCDFTFTKDTNILIPIKMDIKLPKGRPQSLAGIETNNGWVKIESEDDLPKEKCRLFLKDKESGEEFIVKYIDTFFTPIHLTCSHYQEIIYPKSPIY